MNQLNINQSMYNRIDRKNKITIACFSILVLIHALSIVISIPSETYIVFATGLLLLVMTFRSFNKERFLVDRTTQNIISLFLLWMLTCFIRGLFVAGNYWEYKNLFNTSIILLLSGNIIYTYTNPLLTQKTISFWFKYIVIVVICTIPFISLKGWGMGALGRNIVPIAFLLPFLWIIQKKKYVILIISLCLMVISDVIARTQAILYTSSLLLGIFLFVRTKKRFFSFARDGIFIGSFILVILAITGVFNVFKIEDNIGNIEITAQRDGYTKSIVGDSRTLLYEEAIQSALKHKTVLFGSTPARGYESEAFGDEMFIMTGKYERSGSEAGILNIFVWTGIIGVILFFFLVYRSSYLAINKSNNYYMKIIGLWIAIQWIICFSGNDFQYLNTRILMFWIILGVGFSPKLRAMSDTEFRRWINGCL